MFCGFEAAVDLSLGEGVCSPGEFAPLRVLNLFMEEFAPLRMSQGIG